MAQLQSLLKLLNLTPVFPVYQVTLNHPGKPEHAQSFANQRRLANLPQTEFPSFPPARPPASALHFRLAAGPRRGNFTVRPFKLICKCFRRGPRSCGIGAGIICAFWVNGKEKKKAKRHCRIGVTLLGLLKLGRSKVESLQMLVSLSADSVTLISRLSPLPPTPLFFLSNFNSVQSRLSNQSRVRRSSHVHTRGLNRRAWNEKNIYV